MAADLWLMAELPDELGREVLGRTVRRRFARGEIIFHEGDPGDTLHLVDRGHIAVRVTTRLGDVATLTVLGPGDALGEGALLAPGGRRTASAVALEATETRQLAGDDFDDLRRRHPAVERLLTGLLAAQVRRLSEHLLEALYVPAEQRIVRRLAALCALYDEDGDAGSPAPETTITITQDDLASMAGTTRPTANRTLRELDKAGLVSLGRGRITIHDPSALDDRSR